MTASLPFARMAEDCPEWAPAVPVQLMTLFVSGLDLHECRPVPIDETHAWRHPNWINNTGDTDRPTDLQSLPAVRLRLFENHGDRRTEPTLRLPKFA